MPRKTDPSLAEYNRKRDFSRTDEPRGTAARGSGRRFVVQKHEATRLHYDFRLELDGVLKSWAVTRGPSRDPGEKRLAVRTEDHPVSYAGFEGTIAPGSYGAGTVMLWDGGTWTPEGDPHEGMRAGKLRFHLEGERMKGAWILIRMEGAKRENWLLRKLDDAQAGATDALTEENVTSVTSGRTMDEIAGRSAADSDDPVASRTASAVARKPAPKAAKGSKAESVTARERAGAALMRSGVRISSPDRLQYPEAGIRKRDLADYYERVAQAMLPHATGRPLTLIRCPRGVGEPCFHQQHAAAGTPEAVRIVPLKEASGQRANHVAVQDLAGLLALVQLGALEFHGWGARAESLAKADRLVFDLDPDPAISFADLIGAAREIRDRLGGDGLSSWPMLSGGKGLHVVVPLAPTPWRSLAAYARRFAEALEAGEPTRFTTDAKKSERGCRIFVDWLRNQRGATAILPYSTRAKPTAPVAMPLRWDALEQIDSAQAFTVRRVLDEGAAPAEAPARSDQTLPAARRSRSKG